MYALANVFDLYLYHKLQYKFVYFIILLFYVDSYFYFFFFFFSSRRRHTRYIGDWSSDVCSSDLDLLRKAPNRRRSRSCGRRRRNARSAVGFRRIACGSILLRRWVRTIRRRRSEERRVGKECRSRWSRYH